MVGTGTEKKSARSVVPPPVSAMKEMRGSGLRETATRQMGIGGSQQNQFGGLGIPAGLEIRAVIEQSVDSSNMDVPVVAIVTKDVMHLNRQVIPRQSKLFGKPSSIYGGNRVNVRFYGLITPRGEEFPFSGFVKQLTDGRPGLIGKIHKKRIQRGGSILASAALGATSLFMPRGLDSFGDAFSRNAHNEAVSESQRELQQFEQTEGMPIIEVPPDQEVIIFVDRSI